MTDIVEVDDAYELHLAVDDGEDVVLAGCYLAGYVAEGHVGVEDPVVVLYDAVYADEGEYAAVGMVGEELSALCESHGIDAVGLEDLDGEVCADGNHHEGEEEVVASGKLGDEEYAGEGGVHDAAHEAAHAEHGKVVLADLDAEDVVCVPESCEDEACDTAEEQGGGEDSAASAAAVGGCGGEDLGEDDECEVYEEALCVTGKEGAVHGGVPVGWALAVHEEFDEFVSFTVERWEQEDEEGEHAGSEEVFAVLAADAVACGAAYLAETAFEPVHGACEIEGYEAADDAKEYVGRGEADDGVVGGCEVEGGLGAGDGEGDGGGGDTTDKEWQQGRHGEVYHEDLEDKDETCDGSLEDSGDGSCCSAADEEHHLLVAEAEEAAEVTAYGAAGEDNGGFCSYAAAEADGDG